MKRMKGVGWGVGLVVVIVGLIVWGRMNDPNRSWKQVLAAAGVECLPNGHVNLALHIHPSLAITVDGRNEIVPGNVGVVSTCMAEMHTHEADGVIHLESVEPGKTFTLGQFFAVWGKPMVREGYALTATADGEPVADPAGLVLRDGQRILLEYRRLTPSSSPSVPPPAGVLPPPGFGGE